MNERTRENILETLLEGSLLELDPTHEQPLHPSQPIVTQPAPRDLRMRLEVSMKLAEVDSVIRFLTKLRNKIERDGL